MIINGDCNRSGQTVLRFPFLAWGLAAALLAGWAGPVLAQAAGDPITHPAAWDAAGGGARAVREFATPLELAQFLADIAVSLAIALSIAFHPVRLAARRTAADLRVPGLLMGYAITGVVIGFLVAQHGYLVGFVVFGVGTLLRFRTDLGGPEVVVELILVTVLGLCVGLDLQVTAMLVAAVIWVLIWVTGRSQAYNVALKSADKADAGPDTDTLADEIRRLGGRVVFAQAHATKPAADMLFSVPGRVSQQQVEDMLSSWAEPGRVSWKLSQ